MMDPMPADSAAGTDEVKSKKLTFSTGLPRGTCATFQHNGQRWLAYPQSKVTAVGVAIDNALGTLEGTERALIALINEHPEHAARIAAVLVRVRQRIDITQQKTQAWTS